MHDDDKRALAVLAWLAILLSLFNLAMTSVNHLQVDKLRKEILRETRYP